MKLEDQVCSLELAKKLKELGVNQESLFYWVMPPDGKWVPLQINPKDGSYIEHATALSAFTVAELGEMIKGKNDFGLPFYENGWKYSFPHESLIPTFYEADTEADARAKMLIHLIEKGIVKP